MKNLRQIEILIVDDNLENLNFLSHILVQSNYKVRPAINGKVALRAINLIPPDLILLDINLPDLSGYEICTQLKSDKSTCEIPIIFLSALDEAVDKVKAFLVGGADYICKPFQVAEVLARIKTQVAIQLAQAKLQQLNDELEQRVRDRTAELELIKTQLENRVKERTNQLQITNQELESFAYTLSHDLQTSLSIILSSSEILQLKYTHQLPEKAFHHTSKISSAALQIKDQIKAVLSLHHLNQSQLQIASVNLSDIAIQILANFKEGAMGRESNIQIESDLMAWGDPILLRIVLENLLSNAWKYSATRDTTKIYFGSSTKKDPPTFYIQDNGIGFDSTQSHDLFKPFHRMHSIKDFAGTGVGLASVKKIIVKHGGKIHIESKVDEGTTVYFSLPIPCNN